MYWSDRGCLPLVGKNAVGKAEVEQSTERASEFGTAFFENLGRYQVRSSGFVWFQMLQEFSNMLGFENNLVKRF